MAGNNNVYVWFGRPLRICSVYSAGLWDAKVGGGDANALSTLVGLGPLCQPPQWLDGEDFPPVSAAFFHGYHREKGANLST
jgi:hypothetical protein